MKNLVSLLTRTQMLILVAIVCFSTVSYAKSSAEIKVLIKDERNQPIDFAKANLRNADNQKVVKAGLSNSAGVLSFKHIHEGSYVLEVVTPGFAPNLRTKISVQENGSKTIEEIVVLKDLDTVKNEDLGSMKTILDSLNNMEL
jgi:hypothetical protein